MNIEPVQLLRLLDILLRALGTRLLWLLALIMTFMLFGWAMYVCTWLALVIAGSFAIGVLWPVLLAGWFTGKSGEPINE
jgi:hypothetical protein